MTVGMVMGDVKMGATKIFMNIRHSGENLPTSLQVYFCKSIRFSPGYILNPVVAKAQRAGESFCSRPCEFRPNQTKSRRLNFGSYLVSRLIFTNIPLIFAF